ncbi:MAG: LysR family transcriptional regulator [Bdellovibrionales bacterium]|nr:LysR family transcriptional regulator [Bdellovibrionales bacterium]
MDMDFYGLRIFVQVIQDGSFSSAARSLGVTQPTVSQQIARLEAQMGSRLFERVGHEIHLTDTGRGLQSFAVEVLEKADSFADELKSKKNLPSGLVRYAMPESCQWTPHYRRIMAQIRNFPEIRFEIKILTNDAIVQSLLEGKLDFGFVVGDRLSSELRFEKFSDERYSVVAKASDLFAPFKENKMTGLRIISYPGWEDFFSTWAKAHGYRSALRQYVTVPTVKTGTLAGAIHAVQEGAGVAVIPTHCVASELKDRWLQEYSEGKAVALNPVHIARRRGEKLPRRSELILEMLRQAKAEIG